MGIKIHSSQFKPEGEPKKEWFFNEEYGNKLAAYALQMSKRIKKFAKCYPDMDEDQAITLKNISAALLYFSWAHPIQTEQVDTEEVDRTRPMLIGPLFTSEAYPWPQQSGKYCEPLSQFDLETVGALEGINIGSGMLQVWLGPDCDDYIIRIIPSNEISQEKLTNIPEEITQEYFEEGFFFAGDACSWLDAEISQGSLYITGTKPKMMTWPPSLLMYIDEIIEDLSDEHAEEIRDFCSCLLSEVPNTAPHFFGNFSEIQYSVIDMSKTLLAYESDGTFTWGDSGNAQICYECPSTGEAKFGFAWSCP